MKVILTGNTSGFGAELEKALLAQPGWSVRGVSRTSGYDLSTNDGRMAFIKSVRDEDVIVLNSRVGQTEVMEHIAYSTWPAAGRHLVMLSSRAADTGILGNSAMYGADKARVDFYARHMAARTHGGLRVLLVRPGYICGINNTSTACIPAPALAHTIIEMLTNPSLMQIRDVTLFENE